MKIKRENGNIKILLSIIIIILIIIIGISYFRKPKITNNNELSKKSFEYFILNSLDGKTGVIDKTGKILINPEYANIYIPNQSKDVFLCFKNDTDYIVLNKDGKIIFEDFEAVYAIQISETTNEMEQEVLCYFENEKYGLIDFEGKKLTEPLYEEIISLPNKPGFIRVRKNGLYGVIDSKGNTVIDIKYNSIIGDDFSTSSGYSKEGYIISEKTSTGINYGYINSEGKMLVSPKYEEITRAKEYEDDDIYLVFMENGKRGVIKNKKEIISPKYQSINYYNVSNIFVVNRNGKYGFYNNTGDEILPVKFTSYFVAGNYICVKKDDSMMLFDFHGNLVNTNTYKSITETDNPNYFIAQDEMGYFSIISKDFQIGNNYTAISYAFNNFFVFTTEEGKTGVIEVYSGIEIEPIYDYIIVLEDAKVLEAHKDNNIDIYSEKIEKVSTISDGIVEKVSDNYFTVYSKKDKIYIDKSGNLANNTDVFKDLDIYSYKADNGKWGFKDKLGIVVVDAKYDMVTELNAYGFAGVYKDSKWGVIDKSGKIIVNPSFEINTYYEPKFIGKYLLDGSGDISYCTEIKEK